MSSVVIRGGDGNRYPAIVTPDGRLRVDDSLAVSGISTQRFQSSIQSFDATSPVQVKEKTAGNKMYLTTVAVSASGAMSVKLQDDAGTPVTVVDETYLGASGNIVLPFSPSTPLVVDTNQDLDVVTNVAGGVTVTVTGYLAS